MKEGSALDCFSTGSPAAKMSGKMSDKMSDNMSNKMSEKMSHKMSANIVKLHFYVFARFFSIPVSAETNFNEQRYFMFPRKPILGTQRYVGRK